MLGQLLNHLNISSDIGTISTLRMRVSWEKDWARMLGQLQYLPSRLVLMLSGEKLQRVGLCNDKGGVSQNLASMRHQVLSTPGAPVPAPPAPHG